MGMVGGYSADGERLYAADLVIPDQLQIHHWALSPGSEPREIEVYALPSLPTPIVAGSFSPDHRQLAVASYDGTVQVWNVETRHDLVTYTVHISPGWVTSIDFVTSGIRLASTDGMSEITVWDVATNQILFDLPLSDASVSFSRDGTQIATGGMDGYVKIWDGYTGQELISFTGHNLPVNDVTFSPDGKWLASGGMDSLVKVWDLESEELLFSQPGHTSSIFCLEFSPDGTLLSSGSFDGSTKVWDVSSKSLITGQELHNFNGAGEPINFIFFSPDGKRLGTGGYFDQVVRVYALDPEELMTIANRRLTRQFTTQECQRYLHLSACP